MPKKPQLPFDPQKPIVCLAPMDGYSDLPFRRLIKELNPRVLVFTEMCSSEAIAHFSSKTACRFDTHSSEAPLIIQLFGKKPETMAKAAKLISQTQAAGIDINMGCPAKKILRSGHGSDLIHHPDLAADLVKTTKANTHLPVSVKTRLGWTDHSTLIDFCQKMEAAGADFITIHGRTVSQAFSGQANWDPIHDLQAHLKIPVIGNGDIKTVQDAKAKVKNLNGIMIGRASFGNPFLFCDFDSPDWGASLENENQHPVKKPKTFEEQIPWILRHCELAIEHKGERIGMREMRKHLVKYVSGIKGAPNFRARLVRVENLDQVKLILDEILWTIQNPDK